MARPGFSPGLVFDEASGKAAFTPVEISLRRYPLMFRSHLFWEMVHPKGLLFHQLTLAPV